MTTVPVTTVPVPLGDRRYDVQIGTFTPEEVAERLATALGSTTGVAVLVDEQVSLRAPRVQPVVAALSRRLPHVRRFVLPSGEACKTLTAVERTCEWLAEQGYDRGAALIGVGGGATSDHTGFAASIYLRGVPFATVTTTLLGMVDASVGGKTGVDLMAGKNLVGSFHQPKGVIADLGFLETLPRREQAAGVAEIVKAGLIADRALFEGLEAEAQTDAFFSPETLARFIAAAVRMKVEVVTEDERESGRRAILNFGHTIGHAIESGSQYGLLHGEAVSLGMVAALALGEVRGATPGELRPRAVRLLEALGLPVDVTKHLQPEVLRRIAVDKKRRSDKVRFVFVPEVGRAVLQDVPLAEIGNDLRRALG